jgi:hypothetical protein
MSPMVARILVVIATLLGVSMVAFGFGMLAGQSVAQPAQVLPTYTLPPCPTEDSDNCYWDAARMGNKQGTSFITLNGVTYYPETNGE